MFLVIPLLATILSAAVALPADWARRRAGSTTASLLQLISGAGILIAIALLVTDGRVHGVLGVGMILGSVAQGQMLADGAASRLWGAAR